MKIDFFAGKCKQTTNKNLFGLCDNEDTSPAFIDYENKDKWNATVKNSLSPQEIVFIAIDNCIEVRRKNGQMDQRCDCLLTYNENIIFVELKNKGSDWQKEGINQLEVTIRNFIQSSDLSLFKHKRAYVSNRRHPNFHVISNEEKQKFWVKYRVRLNLTSEINIK